MITQLANRHGLVVARRSSEETRVAELIESKSLPSRFSFGGVVLDKGNDDSLYFAPGRGGVLVVIRKDDWGRVGRDPELLIGLISRRGNAIGVLFFDSAKDNLSSADSSLLHAIKCAQDIVSSPVRDKVKEYVGYFSVRSDSKKFNDLMMEVREEHSAKVKVAVKQNYENHVQLNDAHEGYYVLPKHAAVFKEDLEKLLEKANNDYKALLKKYDASEAAL